MIHHQWINFIVVRSPRILKLNFDEVESGPEINSSCTWHPSSVAASIEVRFAPLAVQFTFIAPYIPDHSLYAQMVIGQGCVMLSLTWQIHISL